MNGDVIKNRAALRDLDESADYLQTRGGPDQAIRFLREAEATLQRLASRPNLGAPFDLDDPRFAGLRYSAISRFKNHIIFYRPMPDGFEVLRVLHGTRDFEGPLTSVLDDQGDDEEEDGPEAE